MSHWEPDPAGPTLESSWAMRPRASDRTRSRSGQARPYRTPEVVEAEAHVIVLHNRHRGAYPKGTPVAMHLVFLVARWRGDVDNLAKLVMDGLKQAGVYHDDRQVKQLCVEEWPVASKAAEGVQLRMHQVRPTTTEVLT